jgi:hypothetical protein
VDSAQQRVMQEGKEWRSPRAEVTQKGSAVSPREAVSPTQRIPAQVVQRRGAPEFSGEMIGWVLRGFSVGSHGYS